VLQLHWLPVHWIIELKLCTIIHSVYDGRCSAYFNNTVQTQTGLRSASLMDYSVARLQTKVCDHCLLT